MESILKLFLLGEQHELSILYSVASWSATRGLHVESSMRLCWYVESSLKLMVPGVQPESVLVPGVKSQADGTWSTAWIYLYKEFRPKLFVPRVQPEASCTWSQTWRYLYLKSSLKLFVSGDKIEAICSWSPASSWWSLVQPDIVSTWSPAWLARLLVDTEETKTPPWPPGGPSSILMPSCSQVLSMWICRISPGDGLCIEGKPARVSRVKRDKILKGLCHEMNMFFAVLPSIIKQI